MIAVICVSVICAATLFAQHQMHKHARIMQTDRGDLSQLIRRVMDLETARASQFDSAAFEDLRSKVEGLRFSQGLKGSR